MSLAPPKVEIVDACFRNPPFWNRNVVYFANLMSLFFGNEEQTKELAAEVGEIDSYGGRLLPIIDLVYQGGANTLVLEREPEPCLIEYFRNELGLSIPRVAQLSHSRYRSPEQTQAREFLLPSANETSVDGYATDEYLVDWARAMNRRTLSSPTGSRHGNNKRMLHDYLEEKGMPTPSSCSAGSDAELKGALKTLKAQGYRKAIARSAIGASGIGIRRFDLATEHQPTVPEHFFFEGPCLVQGWLEPGIKGIAQVTSPSVQLFLNEDRLHLFDITEQILSSDAVHEGNYSPPRAISDQLSAELRSQAGIAADWLHQQGFRGLASVDFLVTHLEESKPPSVYVCELNARVTGASYPSILAHHLAPKGSWLMRNLRLKKPAPGKLVLGLLLESGLGFSAEKGVGAIPINFNFGKDGRIQKGQFLFISNSVEHCQDLMDRLVDMLPFSLEAARD